MKKPAAMDVVAVYRATWLIFMTLSVYILVIPPANAVMCTIANYALSTFGRGLATVGVITVGVGATLGKVSWTTAVTVAVGISVLFAGSSLAGLLISTSGGNPLGNGTACG